METKKRFAVLIERDDANPAQAYIQYPKLKEMVTLLKKQLSVTGELGEPSIIFQEAEVFLEFPLRARGVADIPNLTHVIRDANRNATQLHEMLQSGQAAPPMSEEEGKIAQRLMEARMNLKEPVTLKDDTGESIELTPLTKIHLATEGKINEATARFIFVHAVRLITEFQAADKTNIQLECTPQHIEQLLTQKQMARYWHITFTPFQSVLNTPTKNLTGRLISMHPQPQLNI